MRQPQNKNYLFEMRTYMGTIVVPFFMYFCKSPLVEERI
nr:MAG TPA: hypothetical protein [Caudoviricetes sp.]